MPYEKVGKNEPVCIADEVPFEIPENWEWIRLGSIVETNIGLTYKPRDKVDEKNGIAVLRSNNIHLLIFSWAYMKIPPSKFLFSFATTSFYT